MGLRVELRETGIGISVNELRTPRQSRGVSRRDRILDAAAELICSAGPDAVSMQSVAQKAGASTGSMYHFFADRDQLLLGLAVRHTDALSKLLQRTFSAKDAYWQGLSAGGVIETLFGRFIAYYAIRRDALATIKLAQRERVEQFEHLVDRVMRLRLGNERGPQAAKVLFAISTGTLHFLHDASGEDIERICAGLPDVLTAYLISLEAGQTSRAG